MAEEYSGFFFLNVCAEEDEDRRGDGTNRNKTG